MIIIRMCLRAYLFFSLILFLLTSCASTKNESNTGDNKASISVQCQNDHKDFIVHGVDPTYLAVWKNLFDESERLERTDDGKKYNQIMLKAIIPLDKKLDKECYSQAKRTGDSFFLAIVTVSKTGAVEQYNTMLPRPEYECYKSEVEAYTFPPPPKDHYLLGFLEILNENTGTVSDVCVHKWVDYIKHSNDANHY